MPNDRPDRKQSDESVAQLLHRLGSHDAGAAWLEFLDLYAPLIMYTASQFEYEQSRINECFIYACEQLNDNGFRRLLKFNTGGQARFRTWLGSVVFNLCADWHRREYGRVTLLPAISALPAFDQAVYRLVIEQGMNREACFQYLRADFPDLTRDLVTRAVARIYELLTPRQRWQICVRNRGRRQGWSEFGQEFIEELPDPAMGPELEAQRHQEIEALQVALSRLPAEQRLLLRLRFQQGLKLRKIAQLQCNGDTNVAWRRIQAAMRALSKQMKGAIFADQRKN